MTEYQETQPEKREESKKRIRTYKSTQILWLLFGLLEGLFALRLFFKLIAVNPENAFAEFLYGLTDIFLFPFADLTSPLTANGMVLEFSTIIAMMVYALIGWALERIIYVIFYRPKELDSME